MSPELPKSLASSPLLYDFIVESLRIEGIHRKPTEAEFAAHYKFLNGELTLQALLELQAVIAPGKPLRDKAGMNVRVGSHTAPRGGQVIRELLEAVLLCCQDGEHSPWACHVQYESLHPFMDGNGRTGRALWAWQMLKQRADPFSLPFLHRFYYQTLAAQR